MFYWKVSPSYKKSIIERQFWEREDKIIVLETCWRWGNFTIQTMEDVAPVIGVSSESSIDMYQIPDSELNFTMDGCWEEFKFPDDMPEEVQELMKKLWQDWGMESWEDNGWKCSETEMWFNGPLEITKI